MQELLVFFVACVGVVEGQDGDAVGDVEAEAVDGVGHHHDLREIKASEDSEVFYVYAVDFNAVVSIKSVFYQFLILL